MMTDLRATLITLRRTAIFFLTLLLLAATSTFTPVMAQEQPLSIIVAIPYGLNLDPILENTYDSLGDQIASIAAESGVALEVVPSLSVNSSMLAVDILASRNNGVLGLYGIFTQNGLEVTTRLYLPPQYDALRGLYRSEGIFPSLTMTITEREQFALLATAAAAQIIGTVGQVSASREMYRNLLDEIDDTETDNNLAALYIGYGDLLLITELSERAIEGTESDAFEQAEIAYANAASLTEDDNQAQAEATARQDFLTILVAQEPASLVSDAPPELSEAPEVVIAPTSTPERPAVTLGQPNAPRAENAVRILVANVDEAEARPGSLRGGLLDMLDEVEIIVAERDIELDIRMHSERLASASDVDDAAEEMDAQIVIYPSTGSNALTVRTRVYMPGKFAPMMDLFADNRVHPGVTYYIERNQDYELMTLAMVAQVFLVKEQYGNARNLIRDAIEPLEADTVLLRQRRNLAQLYLALGDIEAFWWVSRGSPITLFDPITEAYDAAFYAALDTNDGVSMDASSSRLTLAISMIGARDLVLEVAPSEDEDAPSASLGSSTDDFAALLDQALHMDAALEALDSDDVDVVEVALGVAQNELRDISAQRDPDSYGYQQWMIGKLALHLAVDLGEMDFLSDAIEALDNGRDVVLLASEDELYGLMSVDLGIAYYALSHVEAMESNLNRAGAAYGDVIEILDEDDNREAMLFAYINRGQVYYELGIVRENENGGWRSFEDAAEDYESALELVNERTEVIEFSQSLAGFAEASIELARNGITSPDRLTQATELINPELPRLRDALDDHEMILLLYSIGGVYIEIAVRDSNFSDLKEAQDLLEEALDIADDAGNPYDQLNVLVRMLALYTIQGNTEQLCQTVSAMRDALIAVDEPGLEDVAQELEQSYSDTCERFM